MPFTFSHPAIVLPFIYLPKNWRSSTGLIIGSMAPDFEKFIRMTAYDDYSHTWRSIFYFNIPIALILAFVYHLVVRNAFIDHMPKFFRKRFNRFKKLNWYKYFKQNYITVIVSIFIGTISHIAWDKITHLDSETMGLFPADSLKMRIRNYKFILNGPLQFITSFLGGLVIIYFINRLPKSNRVQPTKHNAEYWILLISTMMVIIIFKIQVLNSPIYLGNIISTTISAGLISLITSSWLIGRMENKLMI